MYERKQPNYFRIECPKSVVREVKLNFWAQVSKSQQKVGKSQEVIQSSEIFFKEGQKTSGGGMESIPHMRPVLIGLSHRLASMANRYHMYSTVIYSPW